MATRRTSRPPQYWPIAWVISAIVNHGGSMSDLPDSRHHSVVYELDTCNVHWKFQPGSLTHGTWLLGSLYVTVVGMKFMISCIVQLILWHDICIVPFGQDWCWWYMYRMKVLSAWLLNNRWATVACHWHWSWNENHIDFADSIYIFCAN